MPEDRPGNAALRRRLAEATLRIAEHCHLDERAFGVPLTVDEISRCLEAGTWRPQCDWHVPYTDAERGRRPTSPSSTFDAIVGPHGPAYPKATPALYASSAIPDDLLRSVSRWAEENNIQEARGVMVCGANDTRLAQASIILCSFLCRGREHPGDFCIYSELDGRYRSSSTYYGNQSRWSIIEPAVTSPALILHRIETAFERPAMSELLIDVLGHRLVHLSPTILSSAVAATELAARLKSRGHSTKSHRLRSLLHAMLKTSRGDSVPILTIR